jgi:DNA-binding transcriptional LysR family regulator
MCELSRTAGKEFVSAATRMLNDHKITIRSMRELSDQRRGQIIVMSVANGKLSGLVSAYRLDYPGNEFHVRDGVHGTIIEDVAQRISASLISTASPSRSRRFRSGRTTLRSCCPAMMNWQERKAFRCPNCPEINCLRLLKPVKLGLGRKATGANVGGVGGNGGVDSGAQVRIAPNKFRRPIEQPKHVIGH